MRKLKKVLLSAQTFSDLFRHGSEHAFRITNGLPKDAEVIAVRYDQHTHITYLVVRSEDFPPVAEGEEIPILAVEFSNLPYQSVLKALKWFIELGLGDEEYNIPETRARFYKYEAMVAAIPK